MQKSVFKMRLKHVYQSKVEFSRFLNDHPNDFWLIYRKKFWFDVDIFSKYK